MSSSKRIAFQKMVKQMTTLLQEANKKYNELLEKHEDLKTFGKILTVV